MNRRVCYNLEILYTKYCPFVISIMFVIYHILNFLIDIDFTWILYICLPSLFSSIHMYNTRLTFLLCKVHRCFVNYVNANLIACFIEHYWIVAYMNIPWFVFTMAGTIFALLLGIYYSLDAYEKLNRKYSLENR